MELWNKIKIKDVDFNLTAKDWGVSYEDFAKGINAEFKMCFYYGFSATEAYQYMREYVDTVEIEYAQLKRVVGVLSDLIAMLYGEDEALNAITRWKKGR